MASQSSMQLLANRRAGRPKLRPSDTTPVRDVVGPKVERRSVVACPQNSPASAAMSMCPAAVLACAGRPGQGTLEWFYEREGQGPWRMTGSGCVGSTAPEPASGAPVMTEADFRRLPLPPGVVHVQPASGRTLVNVPTNVYVEAGETVLPAVVLGRAVRVRAVPTGYRWTFGDGGSLVTTDPGAPYPDLRTTHTYTAPGSVRVVVTTTYRGEFSVDGGAWRPVEGTAEVASAPVALVVVAARAELVDGPVPAT